MSEDDLVEQMLKFRDDPYNFVRFAFDWGHGDLEGWDGPDVWQREFLVDLGRRIKARKPGDVIKIAAKTGKGPGKTAMEAWLILWLNSTRPHFAGIATANTGDQLDTKLWRELSLWWQRSINKHWFQWTATRFFQVDHKDTWGMDALKWSEHKPDAFGGLHNGGRGQAVIIDEGSAVASSIYDVVDSTMTDEDSFIFVFGNPYQKRGRFYELFTRFAHRWGNVTVDCRTAKAPNQSKIQADIEDWGLDSDYIRVNVLGEFPRQDADTLIPLPLIEAARTRKSEGNERYRPVWGLDVARYGDDRTALCVRRHRKLERIESWRGLDTMQTAGRVKLAYDDAQLDDKPTIIVIDVIGVGAGVVDRLREMNLPVRALNVSEMPAVRAKFHRLRDEMYWKGREWFESLSVECPNHEVGAELGDVTYGYTSAGQIKVEPKDQIKERLGRSPDVGEALLLSLMEECEPIRVEDQDRYRRAQKRAQEGHAWAA